MKIKKIFEIGRIIGLASSKNTGKTNNLVYLVKEFREKNKETPIYIFGFEDKAIKLLTKLPNVSEISSLDHISDKENCIFIIDEFQKLKLNDRRYKELTDSFVDFIYHKNNYAILSSPNISEFNSVIGRIFEGWLIKTLRYDSLVNGSHLKKIVDKYKGRFKSINDIIVPKDVLILVNNEKEEIIKCDYIKEADDKLNQMNLFKLSEKKSKKIVKKPLNSRKQSLKTKKTSKSMEEIEKTNENEESSEEEPQEVEETSE